MLPTWYILYHRFPTIEFRKAKSKRSESFAIVPSTVMCGRIS